LITEIEQKNTWREGLDMFEHYSPLGLANAGAFVPTTLDEYDELYAWITSLKDKSMSNWQEMMRLYSKHDIYFLLNYLLSDGKKPQNAVSDRPLPVHGRFQCQVIQQEQCPHKGHSHPDDGEVPQC